jgi:exodeoxyribonuclease III
VLVASLYAPNGNPQPGPKFDYKLAWLARLARHARSLLKSGAPVVLAATITWCRRRSISIRRDPGTMTRSCSRKAARRLARSCGKGWTDAIRALHPDEPMYTFWHYMRNRWGRDAGLRLDHLLLSDAAGKRLMGAGVDREVRGRPNASDHAPAWIELRPIRRSTMRA